MRVYSELMNEEGRGGPERRANRYRVKRQSKEQRAENLKAIQKYIADAKKAEGEEKAPEIRSVDPKTGIRRQQKSSTEYEGPSLREKLSYLIAEAKKYKKMMWRPTVSQYGKKLTKGNPKGKEGDIARTRSGLAKRGTVETGKFTTAPGKPIRMKKHKKGKAYDERHPQISYTQDDKGTLTVAHTEYEGPSLSEADFASALERLKKKKPALARHRVRTKAYPSGLTPGQKQGWPSQERAYTPEEKEEIQAAIAHLRDNPQLRDRPSDHAMTMRQKRKESSTGTNEAKDDVAPTGGSYSSYEDSLKDKIRRLTKKKKKKLRPGVRATKAGRRQQSREEGGSGIVIPKKPHATKF